MNLGREFVKGKEYCLVTREELNESLLQKIPKQFAEEPGFIYIRSNFDCSDGEKFDSHTFLREMKDGRGKKFVREVIVNGKINPGDVVVCDGTRLEISDFWEGGKWNHPGLKSYEGFKLELGEFS